MTAPRPNWSPWRCGSARPRRSSTTSPLEDQTADLDAIRRLVDEAHRGAKEAITDLRDLARGIHPPALDTGLENALATLAARSPVPTEVTVSIQSRPSPAIEAISYFCAAELLANVAQHAQASRAVAELRPARAVAADRRARQRARRRHGQPERLILERPGRPRRPGRRRRRAPQHRQPAGRPDRRHGRPAHLPRDQDLPASSIDHRRVLAVLPYRVTRTGSSTWTDWPQEFQVRGRFGVDHYGDY